jgi:hypothetical protein
VLWNDDYLKSFAQRVLDSASSASTEDNLQFWIETEDKYGNMIAEVNPHILINDFFPALGVRNLMLGKSDKGLESVMPVFVRGNRVEEINGDILKSITYKVLDFWGVLCEDIKTPAIVRTTLGFKKTLFDRNNLRSIRDLDDKIVMTDNPTSAFRFFKNGWLEITKDGVSTLRSYDDLPKDNIIWNDAVIERDYLFAEDVTASLQKLTLNRIHPKTGEYVNNKDELKTLVKEYQQKEEEQRKTPRDTHFRDFVSNLAMTEDGEVCPKVLERIKIGIGYLCHRHHFADRRRWIEIVDRDFDVSRKSANGGNGKSLLINSLKHVMRVKTLDGKEFKKGRSDIFAFAGVKPSTEIIFFDDADEKFDIQRLYSRTTGDFHVRDMRQNPYSIEAKRAPKIVITSNYPLGNNDASTIRRQFVIEVGSFYKDAREQYGQTPCDIHGGKMIADEGGGWNETDWSEYYRFIWECISTYLAKGFPANEETSENFKRSQLIAGFNCDNAEDLLDFYVDYLNTIAESGEDVFVPAFYNKVRDAFPTLPKDWNDERLYRHLKEVGNAFKIYPNKAINGIQRQCRLTKENWQVWVDAGLEHHTKPSGEKFAVGDRVRIFNVTRLSNTKSFFSPNFNQAENTDKLVIKEVEK